MSATITHEIEVQYAIDAPGLPSADAVRRWTVQALAERGQAAELVVRIVDEAEMTALNRQYRGKDGPTNVLSFPCDGFPGVPGALLGDIVICAPVVAAEAAHEDKPPEAHWAHLVIHGVLHLLGYDHGRAAEAARMQQRESALLEGLGFPDPW